MSERAVRRTIKLGDRGEDVKAHQQATNSKLRAWKLEHLLLEPDGIAGDATLDSTALLLFAMGGYGKPMKRVRHGRAIPTFVQRLNRGDRQRDRTMLALSAQRRPQVRRWRRNAADVAPPIITAAKIGISPSPVFGSLGSITHISGHHTAGPVDSSDAHAIALCRSYDAQHRGQGWGGIGYHFNIARSGTIICLRPISQKGAHVGGHNSGNVGIMCHGTTGDTPTAAQRRSYAWLLRNAHTAKMPAAHRAPRRLTDRARVGHNDWSGHTTNACPATHKPMYVGPLT